MTSLAAPTGVAAQSRWWRPPRPMPWWRVPLYPAALSSALVILIWGHAGLDAAMLVRPLAVAILFGLVLSLLLSAILDDRDRGALLATILILILLTADDRLAIVLGIGAAVVLAYGLLRRGRPTVVARTATRVMSAIGLVLVIALGVDLATSGAGSAAAADLTRPALPALGAAADGQADIYIFLLDGYPGDRAARHASSFDRDAFPAALAARGFDVVRDAHSNYLLTPLTLASMLSMRHLVDIPELDAPYGPVMRDWRRLRGVLDEAPAFATLRDAGYEIIVLDAGYGHAQLRRVDRFVDPVGPQELEVVLLGTTRLQRIVDMIAPGAMAEAARARINGSFASVKQLASEAPARPRVVFVHVPAPHTPWVFEADGTPRQPSVVSFGGEPDLSVQEARDAGFAQATHIAALTEDAIDHILATAERPPVIVVMSDHGPGEGFDPASSLTSDLEVRASNFLAALTPGHPGLMADGTSPINLFPILFEAYLGTTPGRQPDSIWAYRDSYIDVVEVPPIEGWTK